MNKINELFAKKKNILSIYFTAGFPKLGDTNIILTELEKSGAEMIEIGIPFSDPLADGPIIQHSSEVALKNGMTLKLLFEQLQKHQVSNSKSQVPKLLMGYLNPVLQYGVEDFCKKANEVGISGVILPDLPVDEYLKEYKSIFEKYNLKNIFLITPQTSEKRIRMIDENSDGFIYMVSSASTTGTKQGLSDESEKYFKRVQKMNLNNPLMIGFGISDRKSFVSACENANGAIIGSAFIKHLESGSEIKDFISRIR
jgi:tryptophan synthase alpha chain